MHRNCHLYIHFRRLCLIFQETHCRQQLRTMILLPLLLFVSSQLVMTYTMPQSALYPNPAGDFSVGDFKRNSFHYLWTEKITSYMVKDQFDCSFLCVAEPKCYSFNMAVYPDSKGLYLCELLATDKYRETKKFHANATFHHYIPSWVSDKRIYLFYTFFSWTKTFNAKSTFPCLRFLHQA